MAVISWKVAIGLGIIYGVVWILVNPLSQLAFPYCDHPKKCFNYAEELAASLDRRINPCDNMYEHVCGKWDRLHPYPMPGAGGQFRVLQYRILSFLITKLEQSPPNHPVVAVRRSVSAFQNCLNVYEERRDDTKVVLDIFRKYNFEWPSMSLPADFDLLEYLLGMSLEYGFATPVVLGLTADLKTDKRYGLSLEIEAATDMEASMAATRYVKHCITHVAPSVTSDLASAFAERIQKAANDMVTAASAIIPGPRTNQNYTTMAKLVNDVAGHGTVDEWLKVINGHMLPGRTVDMTEPVLTINGSGLLLKAVLDNAKRSSYVDLVLHTGWMTFYNMRAVVSASLLDCTDGGGIQSQIQSATQCLENMAQVSTYALVRLIVDSLDLQPQVNDTLRTWMAVKEATRANFPKLPWMDQSTAAGAIHHVDSLITVLTMPEHLKSDEALEKFYVFLDQNVTQPFVVWLYNTYQRRLQEQKRLMKEDPAVPVHREDIVFSPSDVNAFYAPLLHLMVILPGIMNAPFVPSTEPPAVVTGGVGKLLGHELSHAFDPRFSTLTRTGDKITWWSKDSFAKFLGRLDCVTSLLTNYTSDAVFAKNVLTETFADTAGTEKARLAFGSMELTDGILGYTPEQSFYVASCFLFCSEGAYTWKKTGLYPPMMLRCNLPVHNQERFAEAFSCPVGAALNPQDRCTFHVANEK
ncbi:neprilysin-1 [Rhipicephalus sanguineus]|uniref:neprilysin-1 n=1 Tax=Rhipicephalus sanguineus TaxID=34632 RepID=UPI001894DF8B|nr:neprilysin-1 [Rhipicephalus sanguineus]